MFRLLSGALLLVCLGAFGCGDGTTEAGGTGGTKTFEPGPTCTAFCANIIGACEAFTFDEASCRQGCESDLADEHAVSTACGDAVEAVFQCVTELDCDGVYSWRDRLVDTYPCRDEIAAVDAARAGDPACGQP
jgi:hypothetical protein